MGNVFKLVRNWLSNQPDEAKNVTPLHQSSFISTLQPVYSWLFRAYSFFWLSSPIWCFFHYSNSGTKNQKLKPTNFDWTTWTNSTFFESFCIKDNSLRSKTACVRSSSLQDFPTAFLSTIAKIAKSFWGPLKAGSSPT